MMIGLLQPGTSRGTFLQMIGSPNTTPPRMLRMVPFGDFHICFRPNSFTRASSGVMVAHLTPTPPFWVGLAASTVTWSLVLSRYSIPRSKYIRLMSRNGWISLSLMYCQMIRVISSPSSSTTGLGTLIFAMGKRAFYWNRAGNRSPRYSTAGPGAKAERRHASSGYLHLDNRSALSRDRRAEGYPQPGGDRASRTDFWSDGGAGLSHFRGPRDHAHSPHSSGPGRPRPSKGLQVQ